MKKNYFSFVFLFFIVIFTTIPLAQNALFVSEMGNDTNSGTIDAPLATLIGARNKARNTGATQIWIRGGRYSFYETCNLGAQDNGVTFSGYNDELVIFDGSKLIEPQGFQIVTDASLLDRLNPKAAGKVKSIIITDPDLIALLQKSTAQISINDEMKTLARFPNKGYTHININSIDVSQEIINTNGTYDSPKGGKFKIVDNIKADKWGEEINATKRAQIKGYVSAEWLRENNSIHSVSASGEFRFVNGTRYGLEDLKSRPRRFFIYNLLYELDEPGEWYFDTQESRLYVWFKKPIDSETIIGVWAGPQLFEINNASDITIESMTIQNIGKGINSHGAINIKGSSDNILVAGIRFRFISEPITSVNIWHDVTNSKVLSCDFYDVPNNSRLYGGKTTSTSISYGRNSIENCHFTQIFSKDFYGKACGIDGAGNIFKNNLIHNTNGQPLTHKGSEHIIERNELFNVGIEEGDGGAIYTGNAIWSYGNVVKHNFIHHIMSIPKLIGRASIHVDDLDAGDKIEENITYKGGWRAIKFNNGSGHNIFKNVLLEGYIGIRDKDDTKEKYKAAMNYISNNDATNNIKANYVGRMLKAIGIPNWQDGLTAENWNERVDPFWTNRYPKMEIVFKKYNNADLFGAYETRMHGNLFAGNIAENIDSDPSVGLRDNRDISYALFEDPSKLNFKFKEPRPAYAPNIPFANIGLYPDKYRCSVPDKNTYRANVKQRFEGQASYDNTIPYDFDTINNRLYYNSGEMVYETVPCADVLPEIAEENEYKFDLGTSKSRVFEEYIRVSNTTKGINFGWNNTNELLSKDRGEGPNDLNRDLILSNVARIFEARVVNGNWNVLITFGDKNFSHDNIQVKAEGQVIFNDVDTQPNIFFNKAANIDVTDGKLSLEFSDQGGSDAFWQATRICLRRNGAALSVNDNALNKLVEIYPNPANNIININYSKQIKNASFLVLDSLGRIIVIETKLENESKLDVTNLSTGLYFVKIKLNNQQIIKRFIKQ